MIATNCIDPSSLYPSYDSTRFVAPETYLTWFRAHPEPGDILFVCKGSPGRTNWVPDPVDFCIAQDMVAVRADSNRIYPKYLFAALRSSIVQSQIDNMHVGTMIPHFKKGDFGKLNIPVPPRHAQHVIGDFYFTLSERVALLRETNATLEAIAQALFKSWFVDFDPVRARMEGRPPEGMDDATAALFPDSFEESELGLLPTGWKVRPVGEITETTGGGTPDTKDESFWHPPEFRWTTPKDLSGAPAPVLLDTERRLSAKGLSKVSSGLLPAGTLLMSSRAPIGYLAIANVPLAINQGYIAILPNSELPPLYMLFWCRLNMDVIKGRANGSTFMEISKKAFRPIPVALPPRPVVERFTDAATVLFSRLTENEQQAQTLATLRDTLLPRLISGQLRLPEAEAMAAEVA
ncbi:restriction endonuclease subunit S [Methyloversatilis sp. XJ19-49]|uniref:restriction endonuclease subunit S n=1 Tax=Methyloversatilis sp. XJ19-49 TaxID=2963429 RepID=UPI00211C1919|nr:restriction endonuclease subunit S [Methyloversatilis sp. XJ19-49]MCQ9377255.1 restriction endonuclease subunit S [Methyloversatilis sp. XJ19-49]